MCFGVDTPSYTPGREKVQFRASIHHRDGHNEGRKKRNKVDVYIHVEDGWPALDNIRHRLSFQPLEKRRKKRRKKEMMNPFAQQMAKLGHRMRHSLGEISKKK